jgi:hypothetical protein
LTAFPTTVEEMEAFLKAMPPDKFAALKKIGAKQFGRPWNPQPGPQTECYFTKADETLYGGAVGGGKTDVLLGLATTQHLRSIIFRRQSTDLSKIWDRLTTQLLVGRVVKQNATTHKLKTNDNRFIELAHLGEPGSEKSHQGNDHDFYGFDEAAQLDEFKVSFVIQWLRSTVTGQRKRVVFATNPPIPEYKDGKIVDTGTGAWLKEWFAPWLEETYPNPAQSGEIRWCFMRQDGDRLVTIWVDGPGVYDPATGEEVPDFTKKDVETGRYAQAKSRTFIKALLQDNAFLKDTGYAQQLSGTPEPLKSLLLNGSFTVKGEDHPMQVIPTLWVLKAQERWRARQASGALKRAKQLVLAGDVAQGGADTTVLASLLSDDSYEDLVTQPGRMTPTGKEVAAMLLTTRRDGSMIVLDGAGGWGGSARDKLQDDNKIAVEMCNAGAGSTSWVNDMLWKCLNIRSEMWWAFREALDPKSGFEIALPLSTRLFTQLTTPHFMIRDKKLVIESKDDIRKRLNGASTDEADAVIMAWLYRDQAIAQRMQLRPDIVQRIVHGITPEQLHAAQGDALPFDDPLGAYR